jgi:hypothetical protein
VFFKAKQDRNLGRRKVVPLALLAKPTLERSNQQPKIFGERGWARRHGSAR